MHTSGRKHSQPILRGLFGNALGAAAWFAAVSTVVLLRIARSDSGGFVVEAVPFRQAITLWGWGANPPTANPHFFSYPSLSIYYCWVAQAAGALSGLLTGRYVTAADAGVHYALEPGFLVLWARGAMAVAMWACAIASYHWLRARSVGLALLAGTCVLLTPAIIRAAFQLTPEALLCPLVVATVLAATSRHSAEGLRMRVITTGVLAGAMLGIKLSAGPAVAMCIWTAASAVGSPRERVVAFLGGLLVASVAFFLSTPFALLDAGAFVRDVGFEWNHLQTGHLLGSRGATVWTHANQFFAAAGPAPFIGTTLAVLVWRETSSRFRLAVGVLGSFLVPALLASAGAPERYVVPTLPLIIILSCELVLAAKRASHRWIQAATILSLAGVGAQAAASGFFLATRSVAAPAASAARWISANTSPNDVVVYERGAVALTGWSALSELKQSRCFAGASEPWQQRVTEATARTCVAIPFVASGDRATFVRTTRGLIVRVSGFSPGWSMLPAMYEVLAEFDARLVVRTSVIAGRLGVLYPELDWESRVPRGEPDFLPRDVWRDEGLLQQGDVRVYSLSAPRPDQAALDPSWWARSLRLEIDRQATLAISPEDRAEVSRIARQQIFGEQFEPFLLELAQAAFAQHDWSGVGRLSRLILTNDPANVLAVRLGMFALAEQSPSQVPSRAGNEVLRRGSGEALEPWLVRVLTSWGVQDADAQAEVERFANWRRARETRHGGGR